MIFRPSYENGIWDFLAISLHDDDPIRPQEILDTVQRLRSQLGHEGENWQYFAERVQELNVVDSAFKPVEDDEAPYRFQVVCFNAETAQRFKELFGLND